jgi:hypothetical protein
VRLNYELLRQAASPDEIGTRLDPLVESSEPQEIAKRHARQAFADSVADFNPLGQFGAAWTADFSRRQPTDG